MTKPATPATVRRSAERLIGRIERTTPSRYAVAASPSARIAVIELCAVAAPADEASSDIPEFPPDPLAPDPPGLDLAGLAGGLRGLTEVADLADLANLDSVGDLLHQVVQVVADLGADAEGRDRRPVPRLDVDPAVAHQLAVVVDDLLVATGEGSGVRPSDLEVDALARALDAVSRAL